MNVPGTSKDLFVGAITRGTPTHTVNGLKLKLGFLVALFGRVVSEIRELQHAQKCAPCAKYP